MSNESNDICNINNFWNSCPLQLEYLPTKVCHCGKPGFDKSGKIVKESKCEWWINSESHNYCFWRYINDKSDPDGFMNEMLQSDLAKLFGCSSTKIHFILKETMVELKELLDGTSILDGENGFNEIAELLQSLDLDSLENIDVDKLN